MLDSKGFIKNKKILFSSQTNSQYFLPLVIHQNSFLEVFEINRDNITTQLFLFNKNCPLVLQLKFPLRVFLPVFELEHVYQVYF